MVEDVLKFKRLDGATAALRKIADANFSKAASSAARCATGSTSLKMPVQVIWGDADRVLPAKHAEGLPPNVKVTQTRRRRPHPASGKGGGRERRDQGAGIGRVTLSPLCRLRVLHSCQADHLGVLDGRRPPKRDKRRVALNVEYRRHVEALLCEAVPNLDPGSSPCLRTLIGGVSARQISKELRRSRKCLRCEDFDGAEQNER